jgi:hypothetical protein
MHDNAKGLFVGNNQKVNPHTFSDPYLFIGNFKMRIKTKQNQMKKKMHME